MDGGRKGLLVNNTELCNARPRAAALTEEADLHFSVIIDRHFSVIIDTLSIPERLEFGQKLCDQAFEFYNAVHAGAHGHRRDPRT